MVVKNIRWRGLEIDASRVETWAGLRMTGRRVSLRGNGRCLMIQSFSSVVPYRKRRAQTVWLKRLQETCFSWIRYS